MADYDGPVAQYEGCAVCGRTIQAVSPTVHHFTPLDLQDPDHVPLFCRACAQPIAWALERLTHLQPGTYFEQFGFREHSAPPAPHTLRTLARFRKEGG